MLIEYKVKNFMSFKDEIVLSMVSDKNENCKDTNLFQIENMAVLKTAAIFGANASGKSNFIESFSFFNNLLVKVLMPKKYCLNYRIINLM